MHLTLPRSEAAAASAAAPSGIYINLVTVLRAWYGAGISTDFGAEVSWLALMVLSLWTGTAGRVHPVSLQLKLIRMPGPESLNHRGRGTQWSVGSGGGLVRWGWRALAVQGLGDLRLPDPDKDRHRAVGRRPPEPGPGRPKGVSAGGRSGGVHPSTLTGSASRIGVHHNAVDAESPRSLWLAARRKGRASGQELPAG